MGGRRGSAIIGSFAEYICGQTRLEGFNRDLYFPAVLVVNGLLVAWFFYLARVPEEPG